MKNDKIKKIKEEIKNKKYKINMKKTAEKIVSSFVSELDFEYIAKRLKDKNL